MKTLKAVSEDDAKGVHNSCPTCWTTRGETLEDILANHSELMELWEISLQTVKESEMRSRIIGAQTVMNTFKYMFGCKLGHLLLNMTDNLSKTLQSTTMTAAEGQHLTSLTVKALKNIRNDSDFDNLWEAAIQQQQSLDVEEPVLPRKRRCPVRYETGSRTLYHDFNTAKDKYRAIYFAGVDAAVTCIQERLDQTDWKEYNALKGSSF